MSGHTSRYMGILQARRTRLEDSVKQFGLFRECDDVESWITEKVYITHIHMSSCIPIATMWSTVVSVTDC